MITLNQKIKIPWSAKFYGLTWLLIITLIFSIGGQENGVFGFVRGLMIFVAIWLLLDYACVSYVISENTITINSGILIKKSKSIPFASIQNIHNSRGLLSMIFGISRLKIWTASIEQIHIRNGNSNNKPSGSLLLKHEDAEEIKNFILNKK